MAGTSPFVGRTNELQTLEGWLNEAIADGPRVVLLSGEPGVGKSSLLDRFIDDVARRKTAITVLRAACFQDVSVPYLPLATALRPIGDLAALLRPLIDDTPEHSDERRLHLYVGAADLMERAAADAPLLLVIDDLQWADQGTLDLLAYLLHVSAQATGGRRVMTLLLHRPVSDGPIVESVARLSRADWHRELLLTGLDLFSLHEYVEVLTGERPSRKLLDGLEEASAGNPLLARSLLQRLDAFGVLTVRGGQLTHRGGEEILAGPAELDELLRHRLRDLRRACQDLLVIAAFVGEGEDLAHVRAVMGADEARFEALVDEAVTAGVLRDHTSVRFDHPQVRQVMFQRPRGARRQQLHQRVADHFESLGEPDDARAVAVAYHLRRAGDLADPDRVVRASLKAATRAAAVVAWGEAARAYDAAIDATAHSAGDRSAFLAVLHARSAYAHWYNHDNPGAAHHATAAIDIARSLGDLELWAEALFSLGRAMWSGESGAFGTQQDVTPFDEFLLDLGDRAPRLRARVHRARGTLRLQALDADGAREDLRLAEELVDSDDVRAIGDIEFAVASMSMTDLDLDDALARFRHSRECCVATGNELQHVSALRGEAMTLWLRGDLDDAFETAERGRAAAPPIAAWAECSVTTAVAAGVALGKGDFALCDELCLEAERITRWAGYPPTLQMAFAVSACSRATQGDFAGAHAVLDDWVATGARGADRVRALVHAMAGDRNAIRPFRSRPAPDSVRLFDLAALATAIELGDLIDDLERIEWAADRIAGVAQAGVRFDMGWCFFLPRLAAVASARLGRDDDATRWFDLAEKEATRAGAVVEAERVARDRARLLGVAT